MVEKLRLRNYTALGLLVVAKLFGIAGLVGGSSSRMLGGTLLALAGILIACAVVVALRTMRARAEEDTSQKALLRQMMKDGTLKQHLRELEAEERAGEPQVARPKREEGANDRSDKSGEQTAFP